MVKNGHISVPQIAVILLITGLLAAQTGFAESKRQGREYMGEQIYGLDNMIAPKAPQAAKAIQADSERTIGNVMFGNNSVASRMNIEMKRGLESPPPVVSEDSEVEAESEPEPERVRPPPSWTYPEPRVEKMPLRVVTPPVAAAPAIPSSRLTDMVPTKAFSESSNGFWDELNTAREKVRQAVADSWKQEEGRPEPVSYPGEVPGRRALSPELKAEVEQMNALAPKQAGLEIPFPGSGQKKTSTTDGDPLADEVREMEQQAGFIPGSGKNAGTERLLASIQTGGDSRPVNVNEDSDVPMLRPRQMAGGIPMLRPRMIARSGTRRRAAPSLQAVASALSRNTSARGSVRGEPRDSSENYQVSRYRELPDTFYRHLKPSAPAQPIYQDVPSRPRGENIRTHSIGTPDE